MTVRLHPAGDLYRCGGGRTPACVRTSVPFCAARPTQHGWPTCPRSAVGFRQTGERPGAVVYEQDVRRVVERVRAAPAELRPPDLTGETTRGTRRSGRGEDLYRPLFAGDSRCAKRYIRSMATY